MNSPDFGPERRPDGGGRSTIDAVGQPGVNNTSVEVSKEDFEPSLNNGHLLFPDTRSVFALDVSGSTAGKVLRVEKSAVQAISDGLTAAGKRAAHIIPWNNRARQTLQLDELDYVNSGGGTDPTALLTTANCKESLIRSDLWFLLTDGEIDDDLIRSFAHGISNAQLHGTACVVVVFASSLDRPVMCNISVGKALFAVAPDCLFLFHDFETGDVRILLCKGCFRKLLPENKAMPFINYSTTWEDLPKFDYQQLHDMQIPRPRKPEQETIILSTGELLDLNEIYNNSLDETATQRLLSRAEDLDTLVLTAHTRGRADDVRRWVHKQRVQVRDPLYADRPDDDGRGASLIVATIEALRVLERSGRQTTIEEQSDLHSRLERLKESLRNAHRENWLRFCSVLGVESERRVDRERVIQCCDTGFEVAKERSPRCSAPCSPTLKEPHGRLPPAVARATQQTDSPATRFNTRPATAQQAATQLPVRPPTSVQATTPLSKDLLFLKGFEALRKCRTLYEQQQIGGVYDTCGLCEETEVIMCLLLKEPPKDLHTDAFPPVGADARHKYPLVLGNFPETDIVASMLCCDACSSLMVQHGQSVDGEKLVAALPLVPLYKAKNKANWLSTLSKAFHGRFNDEILALVLLSSICGAIDDLGASDSRRIDATISGLRQACFYLSTLPSANEIPGNESPIIGMDPSKSLREILGTALERMRNANCQLLFYPLDGFVVLVHIANMIDPDGSKISTFVWLRMLFHLTEKHYALMADAGEEQATAALLAILADDSETVEESTTTTNSHSRKQTKTSVSIGQLEGTYQLSSEELATFQRLGDSFVKIRSSASFAIAAYLDILLEYSPKFSTPEGLFDEMKKRQSLAGVFWAPYKINEEDV